MSSKVRTVRIRGHIWKVKWVRDRTNWGQCCQIKKTIYLEERMDSDTLLEVVTHEFLHAALSDLTEDVIDSVSVDLGRFLKRLGFQNDL